MISGNYGPVTEINGGFRTDHQLMSLGYYLQCANIATTSPVIMTIIGYIDVINIHSSSTHTHTLFHVFAFGNKSKKQATCSRELNRI